MSIWRRRTRRGSRSRHRWNPETDSALSRSPASEGGERYQERNGRLEMDAGRTCFLYTSSKSAKGSSLSGDLDRLRATSGIA